MRIISCQIENINKDIYILKELSRKSAVEKYNKWSEISAREARQQIWAGKRKNQQTWR